MCLNINYLQDISYLQDTFRVNDRDSVVYTIIVLIYRKLVYTLFIYPVLQYFPKKMLQLNLKFETWMVGYFE